MNPDPQSDKITDRFQWVDHWVRHDPGLGGWRLPVLRQVVYHAGTGKSHGTDHICTAGKKRLAFECGCSERTVRRALRYLEESGYLHCGSGWAVLMNHPWFGQSGPDRETGNRTESPERSDRETGNRTERPEIGQRDRKSDRETTITKEHKVKPKGNRERRGRQQPTLRLLEGGKTS